jgi:hypothetical protein
MQLKRELRANKSKEIQGKSLAFPCIPLAEMGLFNTLRRIQIKKSLRSPTRAPGCEPGGSKARPAPFSLPPDLPTAGLVLEMGSDIPLISVLEKLLQGSSSVSCWQQKFRMLWRRETGPEASWPGLSRLPTRFGAESDGKGAVRSKKRCFLRPLRPRAALPGLVSGAARRGWPEQVRPGRERLRDESEAARQQLRF